MNIIESFTTKNKCYQAGIRLHPQGIMLHSIGTPQPSATVLVRYFDQYQPGGQSVCVHAFLEADGLVYQTLPWEFRGWHCGGAANNTHIGVEMTEPAAGVPYAEAAEQITGTYRTAVALFARLCDLYGLNPLEDGVIIGHAEGCRRGVASNHADPELLWRTYGMGYTMDGFRQDVFDKMNEMKVTGEEEDNMVRYQKIEDVPEWGREEIKKLIDAGLLCGDSNGNLNLSDDMMRGLIIGIRYADFCNQQYYSLDELPQWAQPEVEKLVKRGALQGDGQHEINVKYDALQAMIVCQRMVDEIKDWGELAGKKKQN